MNKFLIVLVLIPLVLSFRFEEEKPKAKFPEKWSAETALYLGPAAGKCPLADSFMMGSVAFDKKMKAARFDTLFSTKGGKTHTTWAFAGEDKVVNVYYYDREQGSCTFSNGTLYSESQESFSLGKKAKFLNSYSIGSQLVDFFKFTKGDYTSMFALTSESHLPVRASGSKDHSLLYSVDYINARLGYSSFTFELPYECQTAELKSSEMKEEMFAKTMLKAFELM